MSSDPRLLISLLDDEDESSAAAVMAELLRHESALGAILRESQESDNPRIRRRIHQLQTALQTRQVRRTLFDRLEGGNPDLLEGLLGLHYQWLDNDGPEDGAEDWKNWVDAARMSSIATLSDLGSFMFKYGFKVPFNAFPQAESFCIGEVFGSLIGEDVILAVLAWYIAQNAGVTARIVTADGRFALDDEAGTLLLPGVGWTLQSAAAVQEVRPWTVSEILHYVAGQIFVGAVSTDSFHYIGSLGICLGLKEFSVLPPPYGLRKL